MTNITVTTIHVIVIFNLLKNILHNNSCVTSFKMFFSVLPNDLSHVLFSGIAESHGKDT